MQTLADSADLYAYVNDETRPNVSYVHFHGMSMIKAGNGGRGFKTSSGRSDMPFKHYAQ